MGFISRVQRWFNTHKSMNVIHHINQIKDENYINRSKIMCQNATLFAHRNVQQVGYRRNIRQGRSYTTNTAIIIFNSDRLTASPLRSGRKQGCSLSWLLLNIMNSYPEKSGKNKKSCLFIWKESVKLSLLPTEIFF